MLRNKPALRLFAAALAIGVLCPARVWSAPGNGLTHSEQAKLDHFEYQVSPEVPRGFRLAKLTADSRSFTLRYERKTDGAYFEIRGSTAAIAQRPAPASTPRGLLNQIGSIFHRHATTSNNVAQQGTTGEEEQGQRTGLVVDNAWTGKYPILSKGTCVEGTSDPTTAKYRGVTYHVTGCNLSLDEFAHLVKSARP